jgi:hypothetical protein
MKKYQFLYFLGIMMLIFFSCGGEDIDYRDQYEGIYATNIVNTTTFTDLGVSLPPNEMNENFLVKKVGTNQLKLTLGDSSKIVMVDKEGNFNLPVESYSQKYNSGLTMNLTSSGFGFITDKVLYIKETCVGNAVLEVDGGHVSQNITEIVIYNGVKK